MNNQEKLLQLQQKLFDAKIEYDKTYKVLCESISKSINIENLTIDEIILSHDISFRIGDKLIRIFQSYEKDVWKIDVPYIYHNLNDIVIMSVLILCNFLCQQSIDEDRIFFNLCDNVVEKYEDSKKIIDNIQNEINVCEKNIDSELKDDKFKDFLSIAKPNMILTRNNSEYEKIIISKVTENSVFWRHNGKYGNYRDNRTPKKFFKEILFDYKFDEKSIRILKMRKLV